MWAGTGRSSALDEPERSYVFAGWSLAGHVVQASDDFVGCVLVDEVVVKA